MAHTRQQAKRQDHIKFLPENYDIFTRAVPEWVDEDDDESDTAYFSAGLLREHLGIEPRDDH